MGKKLKLVKPYYNLSDAAEILGLDLIDFVQKCTTLNLFFLSGDEYPNSSLLYTLYEIGEINNRYSITSEQVFSALSRGKEKISYKYLQEDRLSNPLPDFSGDLPITELLIPLRGLQVIATPQKSRKVRAEKDENEELVLQSFNELPAAQRAMCRKNSKIIMNKLAKKLEAKTGLANSTIRDKLKNLLLKRKIC